MRYGHHSASSSTSCSTKYSERAQRVTSSTCHVHSHTVVPPSDSPDGPLITPHYPLVVRLPQLTKLFHKLVHFLSCRWCRRGLRRRRSHEAGRERLGDVILRCRCVPEAHEEELRCESL